MRENKYRIWSPMIGKFLCLVCAVFLIIGSIIAGIKLCNNEDKIADILKKQSDKYTRMNTLKS